MIARTTFQIEIQAVYASPTSLADQIASTDLPEEVRSWMNRLQLLNGVPFNYLVPDEAMLPPDSIRFFYVDPNWMTALLDGAYSIGRNLTANLEVSTRIEAIDRATMPTTMDQVQAEATAPRALALGQDAPVPSLTTVTGFLLRSSLVSAYPGMGAYAYAKGQAPGETSRPKPLTILRFERLGPSSDTLLCLIDGDANRIDLHEAPEHLHYGFDEFAVVDGKAAARKTVRGFTMDGDNVRLTEASPTVDVSDCFRAAAPRTVRMAKLAQSLAVPSSGRSGALDAAQMGFEMTQGVGLVSFVNGLATP